MWKISNDSMIWTIRDWLLSKMNVQMTQVIRTYRSDSNIELHQNLVDFDQKNIHSVADQSTEAFDPDHPIEYPEIDLMFVTASRTLNHWPVNSISIHCFKFVLCYAI